MMDIHVSTLYMSRTSGALALDSPDGKMLEIGTRVVLILGNLYYLNGTIESERNGEDQLVYIFVPEGGNIHAYGVVLKPQMQIVLL